jgi:hypothetical protein
MQFRILPVAIALLAVLLVVFAADPPTADAEADIAHAKCHNHGKKHWMLENEELDEEAMKTAFPANYEAMGWMKYKSGRCSYKHSHADCPHKHHWHHDEDHWDTYYGHKKLKSHCSEDKDCCSHNCANIGNATVTKNVCCWYGKKGFNETCNTNWNCCSGKCFNSSGGTDGTDKWCAQA